MGARINLNTVLGEVGDTRELQADGALNLSQGAGVRVSYGSVVGAGSATGDATVTSYHTTLVTSTVASGGIRFDSFAAGDEKSVKNYAATVLVYPPTGGTINGTAPNTGFSMSSGVGAVFKASAADTIFTVS